LKAICVNNEGYEVSLTKGKKYTVLPDEKGESHNLIRVIDDTGKDYLYDVARFFVSNKMEKLLWQKKDLI